MTGVTAITVRLLILAVGALLSPIYVRAQGNQLAMNLSARVTPTPTERVDFEYQLLILMRGDSPVIQRGVGALAETLAELASRGRLRRNEASDIAKRVAWLNSQPLNKRIQSFDQVKKYAVKILTDGNLKRSEQRSVMLCIHRLI